MIVTLRRRAAFSAAHSYSIAHLSDTANKSVFGRFASSEGHGHNYRVEIAVTGIMDERTGMVVNITDIDHALKSAVIAPLDGKFLNHEVAYFHSVRLLRRTSCGLSAIDWKVELPKDRCN